MAFRYTLLLLFWSLVASAQTNFSVIHQDYVGKIKGKQRVEEVDFYAFSYKGNPVDLKAFKRRHPGRKIPDFVEIKAPDLSGFRDSTLIISLIKGVGKDLLVVWLAGNYYSQEVTFFIDINLDRDLTNDGESFQLKRGKGSRKILVQPVGKNTRARELVLAVPKNPFEGDYRYRSNREKIIDRMSVGVHGSIGVGNLTYQYEKLANGLETWYDVYLSELGLGTTLLYQHAKFSVGLEVNYQSLGFYTSYLYDRVAENRTYIDPITGRERLVENVITQRSRDNLPNSRLQIGGVAAYRMHMGRYVDLQFKMIGGIARYLPGEYIPDDFADRVGFPLNDNPYVEFGLQAEVASGLFRSIYFGVVGNKQWWEPEGFFEQIPHQNLEKNFLVYRCFFGYKFGW